MKIIFLDVDGVLNSELTEDHFGMYVGIEDKKVELLKQIIDATGAKIVLSSTWRLGYSRFGTLLEGNRDYLNEKLAKYGLQTFSQTEDLSRHGEQRGKEINDWLEKHDDVDGWVVLDDEYFWDFGVYNIIPHWVKTYFYGNNGGLTPEDVNEAIAILNGDFNYDTTTDSRTD